MDVVGTTSGYLKGESLVSIAMSISHTYKVLALASQSFSEDSVPGLFRALPVVEFALTQLEAMARDSKYSPLAAAIRAGIQNLEKWYRRMDETDGYTITMSESYTSSPLLC
jgi:hypothetical protein